MSPRLIGIFAGIVVLIAAALAYVYVYQNDKIPEEISSLLGKDSGRESGHEVEERERQGPVLPTFDIVRVDASGTAVIAGRGVPGVDSYAHARVGGAGGRRAAASGLSH